MFHNPSFSRTWLLRDRGWPTLHFLRREAVRLSRWLRIHPGKTVHTGNRSTTRLSSLGEQRQVYPFFKGVSSKADVLELQRIDVLHRPAVGSDYPRWWCPSDRACEPERCVHHVRISTSGEWDPNHRKRCQRSAKLVTMINRLMNWTLAVRETAVIGGQLKSSSNMIISRHAGPMRNYATR